MTEEIFIKGVTALAGLLAYSPNQTTPADFFCNRLKGLHGIQDATYKHNNDPPIARACPLHKCSDLKADLGRFIEFYPPQELEAKNTDIWFKKLQKYAQEVIRDDEEMINQATAYLSALALNLCERIEISLNKGTVNRKFYQSCQNDANQLLSIFKLIMQSDARTWGIEPPILRYTRIQNPGDCR